MNQLNKAITNMINTTIDKYIELLSKKYKNVKKSDLKQLWSTMSLEKTTKVTKNVEETSDEGNVEGGNVNNGNEEESNETVTCIYMFQKGKNEGKECGSITLNGGNYCRKHKKYENQPPKEKKVIPTPKRSINPKAKSKTVSKPKRILTRNKILNVLVHKQSKLVCDNKNNNKVIGVLSDNKVIPLTPDDIETCEKWGFTYDPDTVEQKKEEKEESESEKEESEEEKEESEKEESESEEEEEDKTGEKYTYLVNEGKYWEAKTEGNKFIITYGKANAKGVTKTKVLSDANKAQLHFEKEKTKKLRKKYVESNKTESKPQKKEQVEVSKSKVKKSKSRRNSKSNSSIPKKVLKSVGAPKKVSKLYDNQTSEDGLSEDDFSDEESVKSSKRSSKLSNRRSKRLQEKRSITKVIDSMEESDSGNDSGEESGNDSENEDDKQAKYATKALGLTDENEENEEDEESINETDSDEMSSDED